MARESIYDFFFAVKDDYAVDPEIGPESDEDKRSIQTSSRSSSSALMQSSVLFFKSVSFEVESKYTKQKKILENINGKVKHGHVLAIMGPSGAGKTTLINTLTLDAFYGKASGTVTLNGQPLTGRIFKQFCFVVKQSDKHWAYLTARETLLFAAGLYRVGDDDAERRKAVESIITKMGLSACADTRCVRLSGGQQRRLSIAIALLKNPTVLFLDEPTSGLDAAAASNIMREISRVAKEEAIIAVCTIHQPSTQVYRGFDQILLMSRGREAFSGDVCDATPYFNSLGKKYELPPETNPAEHLLDLVNADFSGEEQVENILDKWSQRKGDMMSSCHSSPSLSNHMDSDTIQHVPHYLGSSRWRQFSILFRRHATLISRDPILYLGRCAIFLLTNCIFAFVYWSARSDHPDQLCNKMWIQIWFAGVPTNMGVVAVYALNDEFKSISRESQNGMFSSGAYVLAKSMLTWPIMFLFALSALLIPSCLIQGTPWDAFALHILLYAALMFLFESVAEALSVLLDNPILGMLHFMNFWFSCFLFGGFLISVEDLFWPLKMFYYILPFSYYVRSCMYNLLNDRETGKEDLQRLNAIFPVVQDQDNVSYDIAMLLAIGFFWKIVYVVAVLYKTRKVAHIKSE